MCITYFASKQKHLSQVSRKKFEAWNTLPMRINVVDYDEKWSEYKIL